MSDRYPGLVWTHNDSGTPRDDYLYLLNRNGEVVSKTQVLARNIDWEDLAAFRLNGVSYLLIADVGDNRRRRSEYLLHVVKEPEKGQKTVGVEWTIRFRLPDGPQDSEAVAVDQEQKEVILVTKREEPPGIYRLPLIPATPEPLTAERLGTLKSMRRPTMMQFVQNPLFAFFGDQPTGLDFSEDGERAGIITYSGAYVWKRKRGESWHKVLTEQSPYHLPVPGVRQYEGVAVDDEGLLISEEGSSRIRFIPFEKRQNKAFDGEPQ